MQMHFAYLLMSNIVPNRETGCLPYAQNSASPEAPGQTPSIFGLTVLVTINLKTERFSDANVSKPCRKLMGHQTQLLTLAPNCLPETYFEAANIVARNCLRRACPGASREPLLPDDDHARPHAVVGGARDLIGGRC